MELLVVYKYLVLVNEAQFYIYNNSLHNMVLDTYKQILTNTVCLNERNVVCIKDNMCTHK